MSGRGFLVAVACTVLFPALITTCSRLLKVQGISGLASLSRLKGLVVHNYPRSVIYLEHLPSGLNNQLLALSHGIEIAKAASVARMAMPCVTPDYLRAPRHVKLLSCLLDVSYFSARLTEVHGIELIDVDCANDGYRQRLALLPHIGQEEVTGFFRDGADGGAEVGLIGGPRFPPNAVVNGSVLWSCRSCANDIRPLAPLLRPAPRMAALVDKIKAGFLILDTSSDTIGGPSPFVDWCGVHLRTVGLHLRTEQDMIEHCKIKPNVSIDSCAPNASSVAALLCDNYTFVIGGLALPCKNLTVYVATGSARDTYDEAFASRFGRVVDKNDFVADELHGMQLGREELALIDQYVLLDTDVFVGTFSSSMSENVFTMRAMGLGTREHSLAYSSGWRPQTCAELNQRFFGRSTCNAQGRVDKTCV